MTPADYDFLRKFLKERSGLDLSADKQYLVESRLMPLARKATCRALKSWSRRSRTARPRLRPTWSRR